MSKNWIRRLKKTNWALIVAVLSLIVAFLGANYQNISSFISESMFPEANYVVKSWDTPSILPSDFRASLLTSPEHFVVISVALKSERPYIREPFQLSVSFKNIGKKSIEQPRIVVYFADFMYRAWNILNQSLTNKEVINGFSIEYHFPSPDQKIIGSWVIFVLLYDDLENVMVSYEAKQLVTTDTLPTPLWVYALIVVIPLSILGVLRLVRFLLRRYLPKRFETENEEVEPNPEGEAKVSLNKGSSWT